MGEHIGSGAVRLIGGPLLAGLLLAATAGCGRITFAEPTTEPPTAAPGTTAGSSVPTTTETSAPETSAPDEPAPEPESTAPLTAGAGAEELLRVVEEVHGPTADVSAQMNRLVRSPQLPTPPGADIVNIRVRVLSLEGEDGVFVAGSDTDLYAEGTVDEVAALYETDLPDQGWVLDRRVVGESNGADEITLDYTRPGAEEGTVDDTLTVRVGLDAGRPRIDTEFVGVQPDGGEVLARYGGWFDPALLPEGGRFSDVVLSTWDRDGQTQRTRINVFHEFRDADEEALLGEVRDLAAASGSASADAPISDSIDLDSPNFEEFAVGVNDVTGFPTVSIVGEAVFVDRSVAGVKPTTPLPDDASFEQISAVVGEMRGPTVDVAAQMQRLGDFPDLPTPAGAVIDDLEIAITEPEGGDAARLHVAAVEFAVPGTAADLGVFFDTQLAGLGWTVLDRAEEDVAGTTVTTVDYAVPLATSGAEASAERAPFELVLSEDATTSEVTIGWRYTVLLPEFRSSIERWSAWPGGAPRPDGGVLRAVAMTTRPSSGSALQLEARYRYASLPADLRAETERLVPASDYELAKSVDDARLDLSHPDFTAATITFPESADGTAELDLVVQAPLPG